jgi:hypothetical protein
MNGIVSALSVRRRPSNKKKPSVPVAKRRITKFEELPPHLRHKAETLPPYLPTKQAQVLSGRGRSKLYEAAAEGRINSIRDGGSRLWETLSILLDLANMEPIPPTLPRPEESPPVTRQRKPAPTSVAAPAPIAGEAIGG